MPTYRAPVDDTLFILNDVLNIQRYNNLPGFEEASPDMIEAILGEACKLAEEVIAADQPHSVTRKVVRATRTAR